MKQVLSLLTAFVFLQMQTWALSGGPVYPTGAPNQAGVYSGVLEQQNSKFGEDFSNNSGSVENQDEPAGNIGVYSITIPSLTTVGGLANGTMILFINGTLFTSNSFDGSADPDKGTFDGVFDLGAVPTITDAQGNVLNPVAEGMMRAKIIEENTVPLPGRATATTASHAARMTGFAIIDVSLNLATNFVPSALIQAKYSVSGYRQLVTP